MEMNEKTDKRTVFELTASRAGYWSCTENIQKFQKTMGFIFLGTGDPEDFQMIF